MLLLLCNIYNKHLKKNKHPLTLTLPLYQIQPEARFP